MQMKHPKTSHKWHNTVANATKTPLIPLDRRLRPDPWSLRITVVPQVAIGTDQTIDNQPKQSDREW